LPFGGMVGGAAAGSGVAFASTGATAFGPGTRV
jgi:hypothetical protein